MRHRQCRGSTVAAADIFAAAAALRAAAVFGAAAHGGTAPECTAAAVNTMANRVSWRAQEARARAPAAGRNDNLRRAARGPAPRADGDGRVARPCLL